MRVLYVETAFLGDLLLSIPSLKWIKRTYPDVRITLYARKGVTQPLLELGLVDEVIAVNKDSALSRYDAKEALLKKDFDIVFCPHRSFSTAAALSRVRAKKKIGYSGFQQFWVFNKRVKRRLDWPEAIRQLQLVATENSDLSQLLDEFGHRDVEKINQIESLSGRPGEALVPDWASMGLRAEIEKYSETEEGQAILERLRVALGGFHVDINSRFAVLGPGSVWPTKRWSHYIDLARQLVNAEVPVVLIGAPNEQEICERIADAVSGVVTLAGATTVFESLMLLAKAETLFTNDCGAMHLGSVAECKTVSVFGPTTLDLGYRPWQNKAVVVQNKKLDCRPCGKHGHASCPIKTHECMKSIAPSQVLEASES